MEGLQILDRARAAEIEGVLANAEVARGVALALRNVGEFVLDPRAFAQGRASSGRLDLLAESLLQRLVLRDGDGTPVAELGRRALRPQSAAVADVRIELDDGAERNALHLSRRARDRAVADVQREGRLGKQAAVARRPG